ncbi:hypothetical protein HMPREF9135_1555 [Segatella baroniae F0067]|uniref:Uncharacterized protein n=1 Tax=Segatella baroniae F0067 TaxID=1115809 RepID=U2QIY4_9BACT|nr:hypothetical protein HMPREF9135_1555 [Segatella baroniae F0067]
MGNPACACSVRPQKTDANSSPTFLIQRSDYNFECAKLQQKSNKWKKMAMDLSQKGMLKSPYPAAF